MTPAKIYTRKDIVMMETCISDFHTSFYILSIQKLVFYFPRVRIIVTNYCGNTCREAFKCCSENQDVLFRRDYAEISVAIFEYQIQS